MPLIKDGASVEDRFIRVLDETPVPDGVAALVPDDRLIADADDLLQRSAPTGVMWPNDRTVADLAPHLDKLAMVALAFPSFRDGRAYSQARILREQYGFRGELRATGQVLRDQFLFMLRSGFDSFEVRKESDAIAFAEAIARYSVFYQPTGDGRSIVRRARTVRAPGSGGAGSGSATGSGLGTLAEQLDRRLTTAGPAEIVAEALQLIGRERLAVVSSFGIESGALLKVVADVDPAIPVLFIDTGWLFEETLEYQKVVAAQLGLKDVRRLKPSPPALDVADPDRDLWSSDPDQCCHLRKVVPLARELAGFDAWINGRKCFHGGARSHLPVVEADGPRLKFNPLARTAPQDIAALFAAAKLPPHPLRKAGFLSIGCMPCTSRVQPGEAVRAGRWRGTGRSECGIHGLPVAEPAARV